MDGSAIFRVSLCVLIAALTALTLIYRKSRWLRFVTVGLLALTAVLHVGFLIGLPFLVLHGYHHVEFAPVLEGAPEGYTMAVPIVQDAANKFIGLYVTQSAAFMLLALFPAKPE